MSEKKAAVPPLSGRLTLAEWFVDQMGYSSNREMLDDLKTSGEGWDDGMHPALIRAVKRSGTGVKISKDALAEMDDNIRSDLSALNRRRSPRVSLKYFQYLAALSVENFLRQYSQGPGQLLESLQNFAEARGPHFPRPKSRDDLRKLALWIATGGGKTLLMHLNLRQFLRRGKSGLFSPDNVILLTPNETLSAQHVAEMKRSSVPCFRHGESRGGLGLGGGSPVRVLEITKLAPKSGEKLVSVDEFSGARNLVLVDEGHKGAGGEAWFERKRKLAEQGFLIEYSATFGQAVASTDKERAEEYAHAIALDYSYRHFHHDGYGKDFDVVNLKKNPEQDRQDTLMLGNLLVFLQQRMCFAKNKGEFLPHNLESPLMLMLGATVTGKKDKEDTTDVAEFLGFLHRVALDQRNGAPWLEETAAEILRGDSGINDEDGDTDVFANRLDWLKMECVGDNGEADASKVCDALREHVFRAEAPGALQFCPISGEKGEAVLRAGGGEPFGLVYVGDVITKLRDIVVDIAPGVQSYDESSHGRFFPGVAGADSPINILIGARKFMEGWNSWRVSGMGLLNVGGREGPLVFQLFGRGVRLKGVGMSLKRGGEGNPPPHLALLETMNIFGVKADFVRKIRQMLELEGVWKETLHLPVSELPEAPAANLLAPKYPERGFTEAVLLALDKKISVELDLSSAVVRVATGVKRAHGGAGAAKATAAVAFPPAAVSAVDFDRLRRRLLEYRTRAERWNLIFPQKEVLRDILLDRCQVACDADSPLEPTSRRNVRRIQDAAFAVTRKYADKFYAVRRRAWELKHVDYAPLTEKRVNFPRPDTGYYTLRVPQDDKEFIREIQALLANKDKLRKMWESDRNDFPPRIHLSHHLYQPLLLEKQHIDVSPPGLNKGEAHFVRELRARLKDREPSGDEEFFLLRNPSRAGVGFYGVAGGAYPDFILWIRRGERQRIVFVEPHGMAYAPAYALDPKARLPVDLIPINEKLKSKNPNVQMGAFVVSQTEFKDLQPIYDTGDWPRTKFTKHGILFIEEDYIASILAEKE